MPTDLLILVDIVLLVSLTSSREVIGHNIGEYDNNQATTTIITVRKEVSPGWIECLLHSLLDTISKSSSVIIDPADMAYSVRSTQRRGEAARMAAARMAASLHMLPAAIFLLNQTAVWVFFGDLKAQVCDFPSQRAFIGKNDHVVNLNGLACVLVDESGVQKLDAFFV